MDRSQCWRPIREADFDDGQGQERQATTFTIRGATAKSHADGVLTYDQGEIFVYDKVLLSGSATDEPSEPHRPQRSEATNFPSTLDDEQSLKAWQDLFAARRAWALEVVEFVKTGVASIEHDVAACEVFERCTQVALENLRNHFVTLRQSAERAQTWATENLAEESDVLGEWQNTTRTLSELPVRGEVAHLLQMPDSSSSVEASGTMLGMLDIHGLEAAAETLSAESQVFKVKLQNLESSMVSLNDEIASAIKLGTIDWPDLATETMVEEVEALATKASRDYEEVLKAADTPRAIVSVSRSAARHTQELLPAMAEIASDISQITESAVNHRNNLVQNMKHALRQISTVQSQFAGMRVRISELQVTEHGITSFQILDKVFRLPIVYGSTLLEAVRRSEWNERMRTDLDSLRDEISQQKEDEVRRRSKWADSLGGFLRSESKATGNLVDLTLSSPSNQWPYVSRQEVLAYIEDLRALGIDEAVEKVTQLLKDLGSATKPQKSRTKAFKNGSVMDLGQSIFRSGDEIKALQDDKLRLEEKLRASDSRIRKLEDVLHRQSQLSRPQSGIFSPQSEFEQQVSSPTPTFGRPSETQSRRPSVSLRRLSNQTLDEKQMVQRIVALEAQISKLQEETLAERRSSNESREKMQEAESVKRDLMANFEAQRQEFDDERQLLDDENHKLKVRLEEVEDELDRVLGSRDHQRMTQDQLITTLRTELDRLRQTTGEELDQVQRSKQRLQTDLAGQRDRANSLERQAQHHKEERSTLQTQNMDLASQLRGFEEQQQDIIAALQAAHSHLSPTGQPPESMQRLTQALEVLSEGAAIHARRLDDNLQLAIAERKSQEAKISTLESQIRRTSEQLQYAEKRSLEASEKLSEERSRLDAVRSELTNEQAELRKLRDKFAAGETGSDALKARLAEEEGRVAELMESNGQQHAQLKGLRHEIDLFLQKSNDMHNVERDLRVHLDARGKKAKDLSERFFQHNDRLIRMFEGFGYLITQQGDNLTLQRASKVSASVSLSGESSSPMKRTVSGSAALQHYSEPADLDSLYWMSEDSQDVENKKYEAFVKAVSRLDLDSTLEIVTKRYKDVEGLAKKYQKDARGYRDRCHRLQGEAHDKIAYRAFKEGDLALFLPTRNQATRPWAAFNVGAPHYFLREQDAHRLQARDWLLARITKVEERIVDLSRSLAAARDRASINAEGSDGGSLRSIEDENPFELSDGLRWYMIDAVEEKPGAPSTPGLGKSTAAASVVEVKGHMSRKALTGKEASDSNAVNVAKTLSKSLDSRRGSDTSRKSGNVAPLRPQGSGGSGVQAAAAAAATSDSVAPGTETGPDSEGRMTTPSVRPSEDDVRRELQGQAREDAGVFDVGASKGAKPRPPYSTTRASPAKPHTVDSLRGQESRFQNPSGAKSSWDRLFSVEYRG